MAAVMHDNEHPHPREMTSGTRRHKTTANRSNIPMEIVPIDPVFSANDHFCGTPGNTVDFGGEYLMPQWWARLKF